MKKIIALLLVFTVLSLASCEYLPEQLQDLVLSGKVKVRTVSFTAGYDYGLHQGAVQRSCSTTVIFSSIPTIGV